MSRSILLLLALVPMAAGCQPAAETAREADTTAADEAAVRQLVSGSDAAVRDEDIDAMMSRYLDNAVRMNPNVPAAVGSAAIRQFFLEVWEGNDVEVVNELTDLHIADGLAVGRGTYTARIYPADGSAPYNDLGKWSGAWRRQPDGSWKTLWHIWNSDLPPRSPGQ